MNARELHASLEVATAFKDWIARRIADYGFREDVDFIAEIRGSNLSGKTWGGSNARDYHLTLDMAKELAMVERNDAGRRVRHYFIECERRAKAPWFPSRTHSGIIPRHQRRSRVSGTITVYDDDTGQPDYEYRTGPTGVLSGPYTAYLLDYDQRGENPWATYEITHELYGSVPALDTVRVTWDDGSVTLREVNYVFAIGGSPAGIATDTYMTFDAQGRTLSETVFVETSYAAGPQLSGLTYRQTEYDPGTGNLDYSYVEHIDGLIEAKDFNAATGLIDYAYTVFANGRTLAQDYDAQGRLDYAVDRLADGRMIVTDYDLLNQHTWDTYQIAYSASGQIDSVVVG
ncbi:antA/AntB antirepressor family protein [Roseomonas sp. F4]